MSGGEQGDQEQAGRIVYRETVDFGNVVVGDQTFEYAGELIEVEDAAHRRRVDQQRLDHDLGEQVKDNELRRRVFWLIVILLVVILVVSGAVGIRSDDEETRRWAQNVVTTMIGGLLGAVAGYFTAKGGK